MSRHLLCVDVVDARQQKLMFELRVAKNSVGLTPTKTAWVEGTAACAVSSGAGLRELLGCCRAVARLRKR